MLNSEITFKKEETVYTIPSFFSESVSKKFSEDIIAIQDDWWSRSIYPADSSNVVLNQRDYFNGADLTEKIEYAKNQFNSGNFSYSFRRTVNDHFDTCYCVICKLRETFDTQEVKDKISEIVGEQVTSFEETFASKYMTSDYLSVHHDKKKGDYAFIYQMTPDWVPAHGGLLHFWNPETKEVYKTVYPLQNSLTIFRIKDVSLTDHFVSVNSGPNSRFAYTGWFTC